MCLGVMSRVLGYERFQSEGGVYECEDVGVPPMLRLIRNTVSLVRIDDFIKGE